MTASAICAHCVESDEGLEPELFDGRRVLLCRRCRLEPVRGSSYRFAEQRAWVGERNGGTRRLPPRRGR